MQCNDQRPPSDPHPTRQGGELEAARRTRRTEGGRRTRRSNVASTVGHTITSSAMIRPRPSVPRSTEGRRAVTGRALIFHPGEMCPRKLRTRD